MSDVLSEQLKSARTSRGETLDELSRRRPVLAVFLRHGGCPFCRDTLALLSEKRSAWEQAGLQPVLIHMMPAGDAEPLFGRYGLGDLPHISDPDQKLYQAFDLARGSLLQVMGPGTWWRGFQTTVLRGRLPGIPSGDVFQLPGTFLLVDGRIERAFRPASSAQQPDLDDFIAACPVETRDRSS